MDGFYIMIFSLSQNQRRRSTGFDHIICYGSVKSAERDVLIYELKSAAALNAVGRRPPGIPVDVHVHVAFDFEQVLETVLVEAVLAHHVHAPVTLQPIFYLHKSVRVCVVKNTRQCDIDVVRVNDDVTTPIVK